VAIDNARLYESERLARAEAERTSQLKDEFLATLSHELRTPLTAILGWARCCGAAAATRPTSTRPANHRAQRRAQAQLIEDLLDMSSITSGKVRLEMQPLAPAAMAAAAIESVRPAAEAKQIRIDKDFSARPAWWPATPTACSRSCGTCSATPSKFTPPRRHCHRSACGATAITWPSRCATAASA
jgi:signal transduction histidine kinase